MVKQTRGYRVWDPQSEDALKAGVRKHGLGAWEHIRKDPEFAILSDRTGVQLKDKWRNLVKFRHIDPDEQRTYKPKTQGPWCKKYKRERSQGLSGTASPTSADGGATEDEGGQHAGANPQAVGDGQEGALLALAASDSNLQALQAQRHSVRSSAQKRKAITDLALLLEGDGGDACTGSEDEDGGAGGGTGGDGEGGEGSARRSRHRSVGRSVGRSAISRHRKAHEDRRFGIYDRRRYGFAEDGNGIARGRTFEGEASDDVNDYGPEGGSAPSSAPPSAPRGRRRGGAASRRAARGAASEDDEEEDDDMDEPPSEDGMDDGAAGSAGGGGEGGDDGAVQCPCGVTFDDGEMMIECESCATWAHIACLKRQMANAPERVRYNFETYHCVNCQEALSSLQHTSGGGSGTSPVALGRRGVGGRTGFRGMGPPPPPVLADRTRARDQEGDHDTASEDSQRKASELSTILLGLANGKLGSGNSGAGGRRGMCGPPSGALPSHVGVGSSSRVTMPFARSSANVANTGVVGLGGPRGGVQEAADGSSPTPRSASVGNASSSGLGGTAAAKAAKLRQAAENYISGCMHKPGPAAGGDAVRRPLVTGPASSTGNRGKLDGAGSPPPVPDAGLPLFQAAGSAAAATGGGSAGSKIFKPIPKLATAPALQHQHSHHPHHPQDSFNPPSHQQLSAPKPRPHPALQQGASPHDLQRLLEAANPHHHHHHHGGSNGSRGMPLTSVLEAAGPLQVAAANLCAASGRKSTALAQAAPPGSTGGAGGASDGVGSSDAGVAGAASLPPRPPSRPASSMAREVANRIFGESDDDDAGGLNRSLFLLPPTLSRAGTPSAWLDILRPTPDILMGPSPPLPLVGASSSVCSGSPSVACFTALLAQQQQAQQQFLNPANAPPSASNLQLQAPAAATAAPSIILPPLPLAHPSQPQPQAFPPHPLTLDSTLPGWPAGAPPLPPPSAPHSTVPSGEQPVILHPLLRHIQQQLQQQHQHHQQSRGADGADQPPGATSGANGHRVAGGVAAGVGAADATGITVKEEPANGPPASGIPHRAQQPQQQQQQQREQQGPYSHAQQQQGHDVPSLRRDGTGGEDRCSAGGAGGLVRPSSTQPLPQTSSMGFGQCAGRDMVSAALAAAAAAASAAASSTGSGLSQGLDGGGQTVAPQLGIGLAGLNLLDHCRSSSPESWSLLRTYTPLPEGVLQGFLHPFDINWLLNKSGTPPLAADLFGHSSASGGDLHLDR